MKLYYSPGSSSMAPHITLREAGLAFDLERVNLKTKKTASDTDYLRVNPKGYVPTLQFEDGTLLTEGPPIMLWVGDQVPEKRLVPSPGTGVEHWGTEFFGPRYAREPAPGPQAVMTEMLIRIDIPNPSYIVVA